MLYLGVRYSIHLRVRNIINKKDTIGRKRELKHMIHSVVHRVVGISLEPGQSWRQQTTNVKQASTRQSILSAHKELNGLNVEQHEIASSMQHRGIDSLTVIV